MPDIEHPAKAQLQELDAQMKNVLPGSKPVTVQFNPETLKVSFSNQVAQSDKAGSQTGGAAIQFVGAGATKLSLQIWFDVSAQPPETQNPVTDVRTLTRKVVYFITPHKQRGGKYLPPAVRFMWGSFQFDGIVDSLEESLELFSNEGIPLRASMSLSLSQQKILELTRKAGSAAPPPGVSAPGGGGSPGTQPLNRAKSGDTLQGMAASAGQGLGWQGIAAANGIENPRLLAPGQFIDLNASVDVSAGASAGFSVGGSGGISAGGSVDISAGGSAGFSAGGSVDLSASGSAGASLSGSASLSASADGGVNLP